MTQRTFTIAIAFLCSIATAEPPAVTVISPCECRDNHSKDRPVVRNDFETPPTDAKAIQSVTPSDVYDWRGSSAQLNWQSARIGIENNWYALTGRVVAVELEVDGALHIAIADASGDKPGIVVAEVPAESQWCEIRQTVFSWTRTQFPVHISSARKLTMNQEPVVTAIGKALWYDADASKDGSNRRKSLPGYAVWEIQPVIKLEKL